MRRTRTRALAALALAGVLAIAGCAKDTGNEGGNEQASGGQPGNCVTQQPPSVAPAKSSSSSSTSTKSDVDASDMRVGLAFDVGGRGDASFNDAAARGVDKAKKRLGIAEVKESTAGPDESQAAKQQRLAQMAKQGYDPVIAVGFAYAPAMKKVAPKFPDTEFAIVDSASVKQPNVTPLVFAEAQGSFLVGVAAVYKSKNCHIGFIGGVKTPLIQKFQAGYVQGARAASDKVKIEIDYLTPAGDLSGFSDPGKANIEAKAQIQKGADVLYHAAGKSGKGMFQAAKQAGALAIGVDSDQYKQPTLKNVNDVIMTSMLKRVDVAVFNFIKAAATDSLGSLPKRFDLASGGVAFSTSGGMIDKIVPKLEAYKRAIVAGKIEVSSKPSE